ncbi:MAG: hypothetical protein IH940_00390 [Acidobacteria bacterium]|nr:hypothetical protein [Acidobacteriota bacterium]
MSERNEDSDELASAYLDDELDPAGRAIVDADPELRATVAAFQAVRTRIVARTEPPAGSFDAALDAAIDEIAPVVTAPSHDNVVPFKRRRFGALAGLGVAAAAVIGLVMVAGPLGGDDDNNNTLAASESAADTENYFGSPSPIDTSAEAITDDAESAEETAAGDDAMTVEDVDSLSAASERAQGLFEEIDPANLLIEVNRITGLLDRLELKPLQPNARTLKLARTIDNCGFEGDVVLIDSIENFEVVVIETIDHVGLIVIPESCEVITSHPIG